MYPLHSGPDDHLHVRTIAHPDTPVSVWIDTRPGMAAVMVELEEYEQTIYIPAGAARAVADAIADAVAPRVQWCDPERCADAA